MAAAPLATRSDSAHSGASAVRASSSEYSYIASISVVTPCHHASRLGVKSHHVVKSTVGSRRKRFGALVYQSWVS